MKSQKPRDVFTATIAPPSRPSARRKKKRAYLAALDRGTSQTRRHRDAARLNSGEDQPGYCGPITSLRFQDPQKNNYGSGHSHKCGVALGRLVANGMITSKEEQTAREIESECFTIEDTYRIQLSAMERVDFGTDPDALARWLDKRATRWRVFNSWKKSLKTIHPDALRIIVNIIVWGVSLSFIDSKFHHDDGFARGVLIDGLRLWIKIKKENRRK